ARHHPQRRAIADRLPLPLRLRHADRRGSVDHLVHVLRRRGALMASWPVLSLTTFLPLVGALFIMTLRQDAAGDRNARWVALWTTLIVFAVSLILIWRFDMGSSEFQFVEKHPWLRGFASYHMGVDAISLPLVILTTAIMPLCIAASWRAIKVRD